MFSLCLLNITFHLFTLYGLSLRSGHGINEKKVNIVRIFIERNKGFHFEAVISSLIESLKFYLS